MRIEDVKLDQRVRYRGEVVTIQSIWKGGPDLTVSAEPRVFFKTKDGVAGAHPSELEPE